MADYNAITITISREHWFEVPIERPSGTGRSAVIDCPKCQSELELVNHSVSSDGKVVPSVKCPNCDFHNDIKLEGWK